MPASRAPRAVTFLLALGLVAASLPAAAQPAGHRIVLPPEVTPDHYDLAIIPDETALTSR